MAMTTIRRSIGLFLAFAVVLLPAAVCLTAEDAVARPDAAAQPADSNWPRVFEKDGKKLTIYQPQVDSWNTYTVLHLRCAISVEGVLKDERFGVVEIDAQTVVDQSSRLVAITPLKREMRFAGVSDQDEALLKAAAESLNPPRSTTIISIERVLAYLDASKAAVQRTVAVNLAPPKMFYSAEPAILVIFMGDPRLKPVASDKTDLQFVLNTNWDVLQDVASKRYYLLNGESWLTSTDLLKGPWIPATELPPSLNTLPANENWAGVRKCIPGKVAATAPKVFASVEPAELIVTDGAPKFEDIAGTKLASVSNTESVLLRDSQDGKFYLLDAGRWFSAADLRGPWAAASKSLPADFANIPDDSPVDFVRASVPDTDDAKDAVLLASVPDTTVVKRDEKPVNVTYTGDPRLVAIDGTSIQCVLNTPFRVFRVDNAYYCCDQGVWFQAPSATGPWSLCDNVPQAIYAIPPSHPAHNVTYVTVAGSDATSVTFSQTAGYDGEYVADTGTLVFGAAAPINTTLSDTDDDYYYYYAPYPYYYSYGCGALYHYGYGGYYNPGYRYYGPYGGAGYIAAYNPATGFYDRAAYAYGPYGSAVRRAAYNPYTGAYAARARVNSVYGSAGRAVAYNPATGNYVRGGYASGQYGSAAAVRTNQGTGAAVWDTRNGQGAVAKTASGDIYAGKDGTVYKRDAGGGWSSNSGNGWQSAPRPQPQNTNVNASRQQDAAAQQRNTAAQQQRWTYSYGSGGDGMDYQAQARNRGSQQTQRSSDFRSSDGGGGVRSYGGGGGGGRVGGGGGGRRR